MKTEVSILHESLPPRLRETVEDKLQKMVKFDERLVSLRAVIDRDGEQFRVELVAGVGGGTVLVAEATAEPFGAALDEALDRMRRQLKRNHDKRTVNRHRGGREGH